MKRTFFILTSLLAATFADLWSSDSQAADGKSLIVNIDNPNFRKLVVAVPDLVVGKDADAGLQKMASEGAAELSRLLTFSGLFNVMDQAAYKELAGKEKHKQAVLGSNEGVSGIDLVQWKALGVESLTVGHLSREKDSLTVALRTADVYKGKLVLGKLYAKVRPDQFQLVMRRYADRLLQAYTGRPGIFSSRLVFVGRRTKSSSKQIFISDFDGTNLVQITSEDSPHLSPSWSKDGRFITYTSYEDGNPDIFMYEVATGKKKKLPGRKGLNSGANWSHNDEVIAFTGSEKGDTDIFTVEAHGTKIRPLIRGAGLDVDPVFSPNGQWMAFVSGRFGNPHIFVATLKWDSKEKVRVLSDKRLTYAGWYNATPSWSPDSKKIAFAGYDRDIDRFDLFQMNPDGTQLERLTLRMGDNESPSWAPNGQMIVFHSNRVGNRDVKGVPQLYVMNRDGSSQRKLNTGLYEAQTPSWGPPMD